MVEKNKKGDALSIAVIFILVIISLAIAIILFIQFGFWKGLINIICTTLTTIGSFLRGLAVDFLYAAMWVVIGLFGVLLLAYGKLCRNPIGAVVCTAIWVSFTILLTTSFTAVVSNIPLISCENPSIPMGSFEGDVVFSTVDSEDFMKEVADRTVECWTMYGRDRFKRVLQGRTPPNPRTCFVINFALEDPVTIEEIEQFLMEREYRTGIPCEKVEGACDIERELFVFYVSSDNNIKQVMYNPSDITNLYVTWEFSKSGEIFRDIDVCKDGFVYAGSSKGYVYKIDPYTGNEIWKHRLFSEEPYDVTPPPWDITSIAVGKSGFVYAGTEITTEHPFDVQAKLRVAILNMSCVESGYIHQSFCVNEVYFSKNNEFSEDIFNVTYIHFHEGNAGNYIYIGTTEESGGKVFQLIDGLNILTEYYQREEYSVTSISSDSKENVYAGYERDGDYILDVLSSEMQHQKSRKENRIIDGIDTDDEGYVYTSARGSITKVDFNDDTHWGDEHWRNIWRHSEQDSQVKPVPITLTKENYVLVGLNSFTGVPNFLVLDSRDGNIIIKSAVDADGETIVSGVIHSIAVPRERFFSYVCERECHSYMDELGSLLKEFAPIITSTNKLIRQYQSPRNPVSTNTELYSTLEVSRGRIFIKFFNQYKETHQIGRADYSDFDCYTGGDLRTSRYNTLFWCFDESVTCWEKDGGCYEFN